ncbi:hypothetical protein CPB84DRAFT_1848757 [Gymnopilus junonius]|uniref:Homeobox domain-containing protein n=1 Tax=Gymnopilus junonius TaxID=109634 RepID=A0A9P5NJH2_GYMJU|nr:hypothetical protein CPB84DRAFT_1848757 [Gymnopilus junonius]
MPKVKAKKPRKPALKPLEPPVAALKTEDTETELTGSSEPQFQLIHLVHFDELNHIWPNDPRIPSSKSRRAWALARNLNPTNVHSWWYRRRKVAAKSKIVIPKDTYELDVGTPPEIPIVKEEPLLLLLC